MGSNLRNLTFWIVLFLLFILLVQHLSKTDKVEKLALSQVMEMGVQGAPEDEKAPNGRIKEITDTSGVLKGKYVDDKGQTGEFETKYMPNQEGEILAWARKNKIDYEAKPSNDMLTQIFLSVLLPLGLIVVLWIVLMRHFQSGSNKAMSFGKSRARLVTEDQPKVTFEDVAGIDEVKEELEEIIAFLKDPDRFSRLGGKIPKGALLYGPPGTGKTLVARAVAGEANVPFFSISGSDFVEMFVGVGASRVRDLFEQGKKAKPCVIFIDEIDAVGRTRFSGIGGGHDEREQTLNQLLVELDGFAPNEGVIVMASTNRPDVLDKALLRPGRFDRQIRVDLPDLLGREKILDVHTRELKKADDVTLKQIARGTPGFSGADLANLANEAALLAARDGKEIIEMADFEEAKDRVMMGPERRSLVMNEEEKRNTAYHEAGHAIVARLSESDRHKVHKVTIIPRGHSLGQTAILPEEDRYSESRTELNNMLLYLMGGRAAEDVVFAEFTTGAANDLQRATEIAHRMVCEFGMSDRLGPRTFGSDSHPVFLGKDLGRDRDYSEETAAIIDAEVQDLLSKSYERAKNMLLENRDALNRVSEALLERESIEGKELDMLMRGETLPPVFEKPGGPGKTGPTQTAEKQEDERPDEGTAPTPFTPPSPQPS